MEMRAWGRGVEENVEACTEFGERDVQQYGGNRFG